MKHKISTEELKMMRKNLDLTKNMNHSMGVILDELIERRAKELRRPSIEAFAEKLASMPNEARDDVHALELYNEVIEWVLNGGME